ncbi:hypothetical protein [uncultured Sphingomonas sp.]|uniref:hypothetical protein n=1 Tax=uncultured Sphingomonas sp. TaxID=158754 RepID=UPI0025D51069|nr:hypothetical protein [uncultured Sphingomonas sp.]
MAAIIAELVFIGIALFPTLFLWAEARGAAIDVPVTDFYSDKRTKRNPIGRMA